METEDAPVITGTATGAVAEDGTQTATGTLASTDADAPDLRVTGTLTVWLDALATEGAHKEDRARAKAGAGGNPQQVGVGQGRSQPQRDVHGQEDEQNRDRARERSGLEGVGPGRGDRRKAEHA